MIGRAAGWLVGCLLVMAGLSGTLTAQEAAAPAPFRVDFIEETGIDLILLDVEAYGDDGQPLRNLTKDDFTLKINGRVRTIYSVDDLCSCTDPETVPVADLGESALEDPGTGADPPSSPTEPMLFILYLNFGQLNQDGRINALAEAGRWVREVMQPGEQAQLIAWTSLAGLRRLTPATEDKEALLAALQAAAGDPELLDPFPVQRTNRQADCRSCYGRCEGLDTHTRRGCIKSCQVRCRGFAREEYSHGSWSMKALQQLLYRLEQVRGRKTILYFYQNDALYPARLYAGLGDGDVRDLNREMEQVGADAVLSRTTIAAAFAGNVVDGAGINAGANLADYTGGSYNRTVSTMSDLTGDAGRGCRCIYRIGVEPPSTRRNDLYHAAVFVNDRRVPRGFRLQHLSRFDRWLREAQAVLLSPEDATDLPVTASLVPRAVRNGRWEVAVQVAIEAEQLLLLPAAGGKGGVWETGALLYREPGVDPRELLAHSKLTVDTAAGTGRLVVHERLLDGVRPGVWHLGAFIRDRNARAFGGGSAVLTLPRPGEAGLAGPVPFRAGRPWIRTGLPDLTGKRKQAAGPARTRETVLDPLPLPGFPVHRGEPLEFRSWVCAPKKGRRSGLVRYVTRDGEPIFRFETTRSPKRGTCRETVDPVDTRFLPPGEYVYHMRYTSEGLPDPIRGEAVFVVE